MPDPGTDVFHIIYDDGSIEVQTITGGDDPQPVLSKPGRIAGEVEYAQYATALAEHNAIYVAEVQAREQSVHKADYEGLLAAGIPDDTARRLTGYTGP